MPEEKKEGQEPVRSWEKLEKSLRNYSTWLSPKGIQASDLDFIIHASTPNGDKFLVGEFKEPGQKLPMGQRILLNALRRLPQFTVFQAWGPDKEGNYIVSGDWSGKMDRASLASLVQQWWSQNKEGN